MSQCFLKISLNDIEILERDKFQKDNIICFIFFNGSCVDRVSLKQKDHHTGFSLSNNTEKIQLIFQVKESGDLIGCVSFSASTLLPLKGKSFTQW